jgi:hypothetical protein
MRKTSFKPGVRSQASVAVCLLAALASCQKQAATREDKDTKVKKALTISMDSDDAITRQISTFYDDVKKVHAGAVSDKAYTPEDLTFLIEGAYNMLAATVSHDQEEYLSFSIESQVAKNADGKIDAAHAAQAFYELRDKLVTFEVGLAGSDKPCPTSTWKWKIKEAVWPLKAPAISPGALRNCWPVKTRWKGL